MASSSTPNSSIVRVVIVDDDPIFRFGLRDWFRQFSNFEVVEDIGDQSIVLRRLQARLGSQVSVSVSQPKTNRTESIDRPSNDRPSNDRPRNNTSPNSNHSGHDDIGDPPVPSSTLEPTLVVLGGAIAPTDPSHSSLIDLCQQIKTQHPTLAVLVLGTNDPEVIHQIRQASVDAYVPKAEAATQLQQTLQQVLAGDFNWPTLPSDSMAANDILDGVPTTQEMPTPATTPAAQVGPLAQLRFRWRVLALRQIDAQLHRLQPHAIAIRTKNHAATEWSMAERWVILGRCRELHTARWLVKALLATPALEYLDWAGVYRPEDRELAQTNTATMSSGESVIEPKSLGLLTRWQRQLRAIARQPISADAIQPSGRTAASSTRSRGQSSALQTQSSALQTQSSSSTPVANAYPSSSSGESLSPASVRAKLFDSLRERLQSPLLNQTEYPLEIDILREGKRRELLVLILHKLLTLLDDLRYSDVQPQQLRERRSQLFYDLWQSILTDYFGKYYVMQVDGLELEVVTILSQDARVVQRSVFDRIPFAIDVLAHFLFQLPLDINGVPYELGTPEAFERAEIVLDNLVIQLGNSVIQPLLNHLADVELIKQNFYDYRCISSREIARFRNSLSWRYRRLQYFDEPTAIFESTYYLLTVRGMGIKQSTIYASRRQELDRLYGLPLVVTLALELRDALSPRFREAIAAVGSAVIYVLTDVIGRGIGLIGRGVIKGIGSAWQDPRN